MNPESGPRRTDSSRRDSRPEASEQQSGIHPSSFIPHPSTFVALGAANAFWAVAMGAFGAHALRGRISADSLAIYHTGAQYHLFHALALLLVALLSERLAAQRLCAWCGWLFLAGILLFSGSLYALAITGVRVLGAITPLGGLCFLAAWAVLTMAALRSSPAK